ncbi:MAG: ATPase [Chloroflexi bacterium]|nr:MAG: ATPase [Chloroflexota bacterium]
MTQSSEKQGNDVRYFLGIDTGATKSHALIADENGRSVGFAQAGAGNWEVVGWDGAQQLLHAITQDALAMANISQGNLAGAGFGFAGYDWPEDECGHQKLIDSLGLGVPTAFGNDTLIGLLAGAEAGWGVVVSAGTSNNSCGRDHQHHACRLSGMGATSGEFGGATEIVQRAMQEIGRAWSQRGSQTRLTDAFVSAVGATDIDDMLAGMARGRYQVGPWIAPLVFETAVQGDPVAQEIVCWAGRELGSLAVGIIRQLNLAHEVFDVVLAGSLYQAGEPLVTPMRETILAEAPQARLVPLTVPPVVGGVLWGMEQVGIETAVVRDTLITSTKALLEKQNHREREQKNLRQFAFYWG